MKTLIIILFSLIILKYVTRFFRYMNILELESEENQDILREQKEMAQMEEYRKADLELEKELFLLKMEEQKRNRPD